MDIELKDHEYDKVSQLLNSIEDFNCFVFEGILWRGEEVSVVKEYVCRNPSDSFYVWLHKSGRFISEITRKGKYRK